jgi:hypothetical protein
MSEPNRFPGFGPFSPRGWSGPSQDSRSAQSRTLLASFPPEQANMTKYYAGVIADGVRRAQTLERVLEHAGH